MVSYGTGTGTLIPGTGTLVKAEDIDGPDLVVLCVTASGEEVDEKDDESADEPGRRHRADNPQALQVQLRVRPKAEQLDTGTVNMPKGLFLKVQIPYKLEIIGTVPVTNCTNQYFKAQT